MPANGKGRALRLKDSEPEALKQAHNFDFPKIQRQPLDEAAAEQSQVHAYAQGYDDSRVILQLPGISILNTQPAHAKSASETLRYAYGVDFDDPCDDCFTPDHLAAHIKRFPAGQFVARRIGGPGAGFCVGMATNMRTSRPPTARALPWKDAIGDMTLGAHDPDGDWIYGVEMAVHRAHRGHGIGTHLHIARFALAQSLKLRGIYLVGMLMGYRRYASRMSIVGYGERVMGGDLKDPTVSMQMNRGFRPIQVVRHYSDEPQAADSGVLLVWDNPEFDGG